MKDKLVKRQLFPEKLWDLVNKPATGIQWSPDGKRIEVERTILEKFIGTKFRSHNFDSFIRQLHFYGFRKCGNSYHHDKFQRGRPDGLYSMKRKYSNLPVTTSSCQSPPGAVPITATTQLPKSATTQLPTTLLTNDLNNKITATTSNYRANKLIREHSKRAVIYTLKSDYDTRFELGTPNNFRAIEEDETSIVQEGNTLTIPIPDSIKKQIGEPSPDVLILRGNQLLTACFVYKL